MNYADLILSNANVITMEAKMPLADFVAVKGNRIIRTGNRDSLKSIINRETRIIDCHGKTVIPGFIDAHCHLFSLVRKMASIDLSPTLVHSIDDIKHLIRRRVADSSPGSWIEGTGYNEFYLTEKRHPNRWEIDEAAPKNPVVIAHRSLHSCVLNSIALSLAGIGKYTAEFPGTRIERDLTTGEPDGVLYEMLGYIREKVMPPPLESDVDRGLILANDELLSAGITSIQDVSITNNLARWEIIKQKKKEGLIAPRVTLTSGVDTISSFLDNGFVPDFGDTDMKFLGLKIILNESTGSVFPPQAELNHTVLNVQRRGFPVLIHAITREMVAASINSFEYCSNQLGNNKPLQRIEHCSECISDFLPRLSKLKTVIVSQPSFVYFNGDRYLRVVETNRIPDLYRFKSLRDCGLTVAAGSDFPVVPFNPLTGIYAAVTRKTEQDQILNPDESISAYHALAMYTINAARAANEDDIKGSLAPGKLADMVVLSENPLKIFPEKIKDIKAEMTITDGRVAKG